MEDMRPRDGEYDYKSIGSYENETTGNKSASVMGSAALVKPAKEYSNEGLVGLALELHSRALAYGTKEQHDRAMEARIELLDRLEKGR